MHVRFYIGYIAHKLRNNFKKDLTVPENTKKNKYKK